MTDNTTDFFDGIGGGAGAPSAVLKNRGDFVHGEVVEMFKRDYVPYGKKDPELREDGTKKQQLVIILQTENRNWANVSKIPKKDPNDENSPDKDPSEDDGKRAVYVPEGKNIQFAIARAVGSSKSVFEVGGKLGVKVENLKDTGKGNPLKEHVAVYEGKPAGADFFPSSAPAQAPLATGSSFGGGDRGINPPDQQAQAAPPVAAPAQQDPWGTPAASSTPPPF